MLDLAEIFERHSDEYIRFSSIENPAHPRADMCAFLMLDSLVPAAGRDMVACAEHDEIFLDVRPGEVAMVATEQQIIDLIRCGVRYDEETDSFAMFV